MQILNTKYGEIKIYAKTIENEAISQIIQMANSPLAENANLRIMPDAHAGAGCVIGTTMKVTDKICPNLVGVDIGCGVDLVETNLDFSICFERLDEVIREKIPYGLNVHSSMREYLPFRAMRCWEKLEKDTQFKAMCSLGTLGGGNHFIEAYEGGWIAVHSGSRNIGYRVAKYYQDLAEQRMKEMVKEQNRKLLEEVAPLERERWLQTFKMQGVPRELSYLTGADMEDYLHDIGILQQFAVENRSTMLYTIVKEMNGRIINSICSTHNYIDLEDMTLRKGAIRAHYGEELVIPLNMRDGMLICEGKGNEDWNCSAPHGAGRLYSRSEAKKTFTVEEYRESMKGIFSTCINESTLDEAPFVYKDFEEIVDCIEPTVRIKERIRPIYNFKAN